MADLLVVLYVLAVAALSLYGLLGFLTFGLFWRYRNKQDLLPEIDPCDLPLVTVQLPIYNERLVVERLIDAAALLRYPGDRLQIQVIDDSDDDTVIIASNRIAHYRAMGTSIEHICRSNRLGYKAGALAGAQSRIRGQFVAIFDADFQPEPDFLLETIPYFLENEALGMIQTRWGHLNASESLLTAAQSIALDKHFVMEQNVRHRANMFPKFNGSAGIWRRDCIDDAGGWLSDTVCEDLCLSTRASLNGWEFRYLDSVVAPAELPVTIGAYKNQQARWAKGSVQCLRIYGSQILKDGHHALTGRLYAILSMSAYSTHLLLLFLLLLQIPMMMLDVRLPGIMIGFTFIGIGQPLLFLAAQRVTYADWGRRIAYFPMLVLVAIGLAPSNSRAILQALFSNGHHPFIRTPKGSANDPFDGEPRRSYTLPHDGSLWLEILLAVYAAVGLVMAIDRGQAGPLFLLSASLAGFIYVAALEIRELQLR